MKRAQILVTVKAGLLTPVQMALQRHVMMLQTYVTLMTTAMTMKLGTIAQ
jgi:hypothetical protein